MLLESFYSIHSNASNLRVERLRIVKQHLMEVGIGGIIIHVLEWSKERKLHSRYRGLPVSYDLIPMAKFEIVVPDDKLDFVVREC
jgi:nitrogen regulatory protein PII